MKHFLISLFLLLPLCAISQVQQGYVRTLERPAIASVSLSGVTLRASGDHSAVITDETGRFALTLPGLKSGEAYSLQQVRKEGYELVDPGTIGRRYAYSGSSPLSIIMVSTSQLQAEKQRIEDNAYRVAEENYKKRLAGLEAAKKSNEITIEEYRAEIEKLYTSFEKYQSLISSLSDHYARVDYSQLTELEREINICIENGEFERADSLLQLTFNPAEFIAGLDSRIAQAEEIINEANADLAAVLKQQEKDAEYLYHLCTISLARFDNEKARFYIETRAALDTTNAQWQLEAGMFVSNYFADYDKAIIYFNLALNSTFAKHGEQHPYVALSYNNIGGVYSSQGNYSQALEYCHKALEIWLAVFGEQHPNVALSYNNIGAVYNSQGNYSQALEYYNKALEIWLAVFGEQHPYVATSYNNIGAVYDSQGNYFQALEYHNKALEISLAVFGERHPDVATCYNNIGLVYGNQGNYSQALEYYNKALEIWLAVFGEQHPNVALSYNNIGYVYDNQSNYSQALEYYNKALEIWLAVFGEQYPDVATCYNNMGTVYDDQSNYSQALEYYNKALEIRLAVFGEQHPDVATCYHNIGTVYSIQGNYSQALEYFNKALEIWLAVFGEQHPNVAASYAYIAAILFRQGNYQDSLGYFEKSYNILNDLLPSDHPRLLQIQKIYELVKSNISE